MRQITLDIPIVKVILGGNRKKSTRGMLVFDMGLALTQLDIDLVETLGYSACDANGIRTVKGPTGDAVEGYVFSMSSLLLFGKEVNNAQVLTYDFKNFPAVDGLLGWDIIRLLHLELDGPNGLLKIF